MDGGRPAPHWGYAIRESTDRRVIVLEGDIDLAAADPLRDIFAAAAREVAAVEVDMSGVDFLDSTGIGVLVGGRNAALAHGSTFVVTRPSEPVSSVLEMSGVLQTLTGDTEPPVTRSES